MRFPSLFFLLLAACSGGDPHALPLDDGGSHPGPDGGGHGSDAGGPSVGEPAALAGITARHNAVRGSVTPSPLVPLGALTWSSALAADAQEWADECHYGHSGNGHGENVYATTGTSAQSVASVVESWASESSHYDYAANTCSGDCGHYTQVVWDETTSVGCGYRACSTGSPFDVGTYGQNWVIVVCDYDPPGNDGSRPY